MRPSVMIVEDEPAIREVYLIKFELEGYRVCGAENGQQAMELMESFQPDVVLLDLMMPVMNGLEFLRQVREKEYLADIFVFSNLPAPEQVQQAKALGAVDYWIKSDYTPELAAKKVMDQWRKKQKPPTTS